MLTEHEKQWLEERKQYIQRFYSETFCKYCYYFKEIPKGWACDADICPTDRRDHDYEDAAEFEARVAAKLAKECSAWWPCGEVDECISGQPCRECHLKHARLVVEEEMEKEKK